MYTVIGWGFDGEVVSRLEDPALTLENSLPKAYEVWHTSGVLFVTVYMDGVPIAHIGTNSAFRASEPVPPAKADPVPEPITTGNLGTMPVDSVLLLTR
jgi:hypothetical protein